MPQLITKIRKRSGKIVDFKKDKIIKAIDSAARSVGTNDKSLVTELSKEVFDKLNSKFHKNSIPAVEEVQDLVEEVLIKKNKIKVAKAYILYRDQHRQLREIKSSTGEKLMEDYLGKLDWRLKENSNMSYSVQGLNNYIASAVSARYWLNKLYPKNIREAHVNGDLHIHDLGLLAPYCCGWDLKDLLIKGFGGVNEKVQSKAPKHFRSALGQAINFFYTMQGEAAGAQAFANFDTYLAPFIRYDNLSFKQVKQSLQEFMFNVNVPTRVGFQTPFTNVTLDVVPSKMIGEENVILGGEIKKEKYKDFQEEMDMFNKAFAEVMLEGDSTGRVFSFPIPTYNIDKNFDYDRESLKPMWEMTSKYGIPYFSNFVNSDMDRDDARSMCLLPEEDILIKQDNNIQKITIGELFDESKGKQLDDEWFDMKSPVEALSLNPESGKLEWVGIQKMLRVVEQSLVNIRTKDGKTMRVSPDHLVAVYTKDGIITKKAKEIDENDFLLVMKDENSVFQDDQETIFKESIEWLRNSDFAVVKVAETITSDLNYDQEFFDIELEKNHYFVHSQGNITHNCCRLRLDNRELRKRGGGLFGANPLTGSIGVVTLNLARVGYLAKTKKEFKEKVFELMDMAKDSLEQKRKVVEELSDVGLYPYSTHYLADIKQRFGNYWQNHFSTIGINGMNEALLNFMGENIASDKGQEFTKEILDVMRERLMDYQNNTNHLYNLEASPAEGATYRFAKKDKELYPEIICANQEAYEDGREPYYTNSTQLPVDYTDDIFTALEKQEDLQTKYTGGTVLHGYLGEKIDDIEQTKTLVKTIVNNYKLPYFTITPTFSICPKHGYLKGEHKY
ncbi:ribonucleoside triphosphate reductase, partial [Patescibacteria group bacterium]|nr:ribonucleoside triphosphate reductase [Patescibacteria group bacterium]